MHAIAPHDEREAAAVARVEWGGMSSIRSTGFFGNIWWRSHELVKIGDVHAGHRHNHDHVTMVTRGAVRCEAAGHAPKEFRAGSVIVIAKDQWHRMTALEDGTQYFCVFAMRDVAGNLTDVYCDESSPYGEAPFSADEVARMLQAATTQTCPGCSGCKGSQQ